jgi:hypothetical protein
MAAKVFCAKSASGGDNAAGDVIAARSSAHPAQSSAARRSNRLKRLRGDAAAKRRGSRGFALSTVRSPP